jgi:hypothetical protein
MHMQPTIISQTCLYGHISLPKFMRILKPAVRHIEVAIADPCAEPRKHKYTKTLYFIIVANLDSINWVVLLPRRSAKDPILDTSSHRASMMWQVVLFERTDVAILQFKNQRLLYLLVLLVRTSHLRLGSKG